jgi:hypothetical protein
MSWGFVGVSSQGAVEGGLGAAQIPSDAIDLDQGERHRGIVGA